MASWPTKPKSPNSLNADAPVDTAVSRAGRGQVLGLRPAEMLRPPGTVTWALAGGACQSCQQPCAPSSNTEDAELLGVPEPASGPIVRPRPNRQCGCCQKLTPMLRTECVEWGLMVALPCVNSQVRSTAVRPALIVAK